MSISVARGEKIVEEMDLESFEHESYNFIPLHALKEEFDGPTREREESTPAGDKENL